MDLPQDQQVWVLLAFVAVAAFWLGRMTGRAEGSPENRMAQSAASSELFSSMAPDKQADVDRLISERKYIEAIKLVRDVTGAGLREAKLAVDERRKQLGR